MHFVGDIESTGLKSVLSHLWPNDQTIFVGINNTQYIRNSSRKDLAVLNHMSYSTRRNKQAGYYVPTVVTTSYVGK
jgi:hypothetical protein